MKALLGVVLGAVALTGCNGTPGTSAAPSTPSHPSGTSAAFGTSGAVRERTAPSQYVFADNDTDLGSPGAAEIDYWPVGTSGDAPPTGVISGSNTGLVAGVEGIVVDGSGEIYVANNTTNEIRGFPANSNGNVSPNVLISGSNTGLQSPIGLAIDSSGNLFVVNCGGNYECHGHGQGAASIAEFASGSNGNVAPIRTISGKRTQLDVPFSIALSATGEIYTVNTDLSAAPAILLFKASADGNAAPRKVITGQRTKLRQPYGIAESLNGIYAGSWPSPYIVRFAPRANGDARPRARIEGSSTQLNCCMDGMAIGSDSSLYVVDRGNASAPPSILQFTALAAGNVAPLTSISGPDTRLYVPTFVYVGGPSSK